MDVLLTGAGGQLGFEVAARARDSGLEIAAFAHGDLDIADRAAVDRAVASTRPKIIVNAAAYTAVDKAEADLDAAYAANRDGPAYLAAAAQRCGAAIIHVSTDYVFDGTKPAPYVETDPVAPLGVYGASKLAGEEAVRKACDRHVILRTAWVYGAKGHNFVKTMLRLGSERDVLRVVDDQIGSPTSAADLAQVIVAISRRLCLDAVSPACYGTFHAAGSGETSWHGFAREIFRQAEGRGLRIPKLEAIPSSQFPTPAARPANSRLDCAKLAKVHGIRFRSWQDALAEVMASLNNERTSSGLTRNSGNSSP
ncbi:dTDP-4-dehydrorhamnose reductase [Rhizobiales bacterium]|uniref:dTDP-4-dehydrorhamnose reductase n=1 Tax=Hongsoonwoonella zoysiae TaxID=2821844 RepID=UPI0015617E5E|nr:dTDP-4-dehydrorhamnose reductase [Hongsoonwoonella zoysiae]NRG18534.1 dTDP-4-dehydrorhamnose reductase [Hongsoonwoonella zoysiae]